jgi:hypothetical protein
MNPLEVWRDALERIASGEEEDPERLAQEALNMFCSVSTCFEPHATKVLLCEAHSKDWHATVADRGNPEGIHQLPIWNEFLVEAASR